MHLSAGDFELASEVVYLFDESNVFLQEKLALEEKIEYF